MKKFLVAFAIALLALPAAAQHHHHHHHRHHGHGGHNNWVGPLVGGIILGAVISNSRPVQAAEPVVVMPPVQSPVPPITATYYSCLVRVLDPMTGAYRNEVMVCIR